MTGEGRKVAVVTGASSGIGAAAARALAAAGFGVILGARRMDRLEALADEIGGTAARLDVTDADSVAAFCAAVPQRLHLLVNNAGGAHGLDPVAQASDDDWAWMFEANVLGLMRVTRALLPRLEALAREIGGTARALDVTEPSSVTEFCAAVPERLHLLVNNAGGAHGLDPVARANDDDWAWMFEANVLGLMRVTRALLPRLEAGRGHVVNVTSIAGREVYPGGAGYTAAKHAAVAVTRTLRLELNGKPVRVTDIAPGMVETDFSAVRFAGDTGRAAKVYQGLTPLTAEDIADCIVWAATRPPHVNVDEIVVKPVAQASATVVARGAGL